MPHHNNLNRAIETTIAEATGTRSAIASESGVGGGCISDARVVTLEDGREFFVKSNPHPLPHMFPREAEGLNAMADANAIRVPRALGTGGEDNSVTPYIVMEYIRSGREEKGFHESFGRQFAQMHLNTKHNRYGFEHDNYLGSTPQRNTWEDDWVEFWRQHRLGYQLNLARKRGLSDAAMDKAGDRMMERLDELIGEPAEPACLLHGDLWGGNYMADENGEPVLIDPAVYYGRREADLAMTMLFGGFNSRFYAAYEETWPLEPGSSERLEIYKLYHLLNHLNLFGSGYYGGCMGILKRYE